VTPALSWTVVAAVLFGALLHASWNALIKSGPDKALDTALIHVLGCAVGALAVLFPFVIGSSLGLVAGCDVLGARR